MNYWKILNWIAKALMTLAVFFVIGFMPAYILWNLLR